jgi:hypothetical protein
MLWVKPATVVPVAPSRLPALVALALEVRTAVIGREVRDLIRQMNSANPLAKYRQCSLGGLLGTTRPSQFFQQIVKSKACGSPLLLTRNMGENFRIYISAFFYDDVLISFFIDRLLALFAQYCLRHL